MPLPAEPCHWPWFVILVHVLTLQHNPSLNSSDPPASQPKYQDHKYESLGSQTLNSRRQMGGLNFLLGVHLFFHFSCIVFNFITVCVHAHRCSCTIAYQWRPEASSGAGPLLLPWMELRSDFGSKPFYFLSPLVNPDNIFKSPKIIAKA